MTVFFIFWLVNKWLCSKYPEADGKMLLYYFFFFSDLNVKIFSLQLHKPNMTRALSYLRSWNISHQILLHIRGHKPNRFESSTLVHMSDIITIVLDSSPITVKETQKQRKEAKLIKQLEKQKEQEAAEKERLAQKQHKKGNVTHIQDSQPVHLWIKFCNVWSAPLSFRSTLHSECGSTRLCSG